MTEEQRLILTMVQEGRISAEQAERLLAALSEAPESETGAESDRSSEWAGSETDWDDESREVLVANIQCHVQDEMSRVQDELRRARDQVQAELHRVMPEVRRAHEEVRRAVGHALVELRRVIS